MPYKLWSPFERLLSADMNEYVSGQAVSIFASAAARDLAIPAPTVGQVCWLSDLGALQAYSGAAWKIVQWAGGNPGATLKSVGSQVVTAGTLPKITTLTAVERDTHGYALGSSELTIPAGLGGRYLLVLAVDYTASTGGGHRYATIEKVAGPVKLVTFSMSVSASTPINFMATGFATLAAGDKIQAVAGNGTSASTTLQTVADFATKLSIQWLGE